MKLALTLFAALAPLAALAAGGDCTSASAIAAAQARIDETLQAVAREPGERQAKLGAALKAKADAQGWPAQRQEDLLKQVLASTSFQAFEQEKTPHIQALSQAVLSSSGPDAQATKCQAAKQAAAAARKLTEVNARQYRHAGQQIDRAAEAGR